MAATRIAACKSRGDGRAAFVTARLPVLCQRHSRRKNGGGKAAGLFFVCCDHCYRGDEHAFHFRLRSNDCRAPEHLLLSKGDGRRLYDGVFNTLQFRNLHLARIKTLFVDFIVDAKVKGVAEIDFGVASQLHEKTPLPMRLGVEFRKMPLKGPLVVLIPSAQRLVWAAKQALGKAALGALFA